MSCECAGCPVYSDGYRCEDMCSQCDCWFEGLKK